MIQTRIQIQLLTNSWTRYKITLKQRFILANNSTRVFFFNSNIHTQRVFVSSTCKCIKGVKLKIGFRIDRATMTMVANGTAECQHIDICMGIGILPLMH